MFFGRPPAQRFFRILTVSPPGNRSQNGAARLAVRPQ